MTTIFQRPPRVFYSLVRRLRLARSGKLRRDRPHLPILGPMRTLPRTHEVGSWGHRTVIFGMRTTSRGISVAAVRGSTGRVCHAAESTACSGSIRRRSACGSSRPEQGPALPVRIPSVFASVDPACPEPLDRLRRSRANGLRSHAVPGVRRCRRSTVARGPRRRVTMRADPSSREWPRLGRSPWPRRASAVVHLRWWSSEMQSDPSGGGV